MEAKVRDKIAKSIYRKFPEVNGVKPKVRLQRGAGAKSKGGEAIYLLVFRGKAQGPNGASFPRNVRVTADARGKIIKVSTSRG